MDHTSEIELKQLVEQVRPHPDGLGITALLQTSKSTTRRSLQRRLSRLVQQGRLLRTGAARGVRYHVPANTSLTERPRHFHVYQEGEEYFPISPEGDEIRALVRRPRHQRCPVAYKFSMLENYRPNQTCYLPLKLRQQLFHMGGSPDTVRPAGTFARDLLGRLLIDLSWASSRMEGNTYTLLDTARLIEAGEVAEGKDAMETQMILNHRDAIEFLVRDPALAGMHPDTLLTLHGYLSKGLLSDPSACARLRRRPVGISGTVYLPPEIPQVVEELFGVLVGMSAEIRDPFEQAFFLMVHLPYLQPFEDVNKRVSRLAANIPLICHNLCPLSFIGIPQRAYIDGLLGVYELNRIELLRDVFVYAYAKSCQQYVAVRETVAKPDIFRIRYHGILDQVIAAVVRHGEPASEASVRARLPATVTVQDQDHFIELVLLELTGLHPGNAICFGISPSEFNAWLSKSCP